MYNNCLKIVQVMNMFQQLFKLYYMGFLAWTKQDQDKLKQAGSG